MSTTASLLNWIDQQQQPMIDQLLRLSSINSGSGNLEGLAVIAAEFRSLFEPLAENVESIELEDQQRMTDAGSTYSQPSARLLRFCCRPQAPVRILLTGHLDTVFDAEHPFQRPKFEDEHRINGPGVADMKGGLLVMLLALQAWERRTDAGQLGWEVILNPDEETGSLASAPVLAEAAGRAHVGLVYEPALADGTLAGRRKGSGNFTFLVRGRSAHAGREFDKGRNAIAALAEAMTALNRLNQKRAGITLNLGKITGGDALNVVPDLALCRFNVRSETEVDQHWVQAELERILTEINGLDGISAELDGQFNRPPKQISPANQRLFDLLRDCGEQLGVMVGFRATGGCCDGNNLAAAGLPNIDTLGVRGGNIHTDQEFMIVESLSERAKLSFLLLEKLAQQGAELRQLQTGA